MKLEKVLIRGEFAEPHRVYATSEDREQVQTRILSEAIKDLIKQEIQVERDS